MKSRTQRRKNAKRVEIVVVDSNCTPDQTARQKAWSRKNAEAIVSYNKFVVRHGVFSQSTRSF
jgi:hypothetical protein